MRSGGWLRKNMSERRERKRAKAAHFHACWLFWLPQSPSIAFSFLCSVPFASWLWTETGLSTRLSFEVLWLSATRGGVPAAICEGATSSRQSLYFPSMNKRGRSQEWRWGWQWHLVHVGQPHMVEPIAALRNRYTLKYPPPSMPSSYRTSTLILISVCKHHPSNLPFFPH